MHSKSCIYYNILHNHMHKVGSRHFMSEFFYALLCMPNRLCSCFIKSTKMYRHCETVMVKRMNLNMKILYFERIIKFKVVPLL